jgi:hypothetical protein
MSMKPSPEYATLNQGRHYRRYTIVDPNRSNRTRRRAAAVAARRAAKSDARKVTP